MFRAAMCPSSGELIVSIRHLVCHSAWMTDVCAGLDETHPNLHTQRSSIQSDTTYTRCRIDTINSPNDGHMAAPNM